MMWIAGVSPTRVFEAIIGAAIALFIFGIPAAVQQQKFSPMCHAHGHTRVDWVRIGIITVILVSAVTTNLVVNLKFTAQAEAFPFIGAAIWMAILISVGLRRPDWEALPRALKGSVFLLALVLCASMMPVEKLPAASWQTTFGFGFLSAVFDNIPLTALALKQGGYDWGFLAYAVGFGGSMIWFGSSAGVALASMYPEARSIGRWLRHGWYVPIGYAAGFFAMLAFWGWHVDSPAARSVEPTALAQPVWVSTDA
jgi:hypothetical protein